VRPQGKVRNSQSFQRSVDHGHHVIEGTPGEGQNAVALPRSFTRRPPSELRLMADRSRKARGSSLISLDTLATAGGYPTRLQRAFFDTKDSNTTPDL